MVASVVVLPLPVGPVTTIMPCGSASSRVMIASSRGDRPSLPISSRPRSRGSRRMTADSPCCVGMVATRTSSSVRADADARRAVLRQAALGDVEAGENLDARDQRLRQHAGRRRHRAQQPVDAHAHHEPGAERLDMDVARAQLDRALQQIVDRAHHRRAARKIAQAFDVVVGLLARRPAHPRSAVRVIRLDALVEHGGDVLEGGHRDLDRLRRTRFRRREWRRCRRDRRPRAGSRRSASAPGRSWTRAGSGGKIRRGMASPPAAAAGSAAPRPSSRKPRRRIRRPKDRWLPTIREAVASGLNSPAFSTRARARAGKEYFSRRCCRKVSAERSRIEFPPLTFVTGINSSHVQTEGLCP